MNQFLFGVLLFLSLGAMANDWKSDRPDRITEQEATQLVRELFVPLCGEKRFRCAIALDSRGACAFEFFVMLPSEEGLSAKPRIVRLGMDRRGAVIGISLKPESVCASA